MGENQAEVLAAPSAILLSTHQARQGLEDGPSDGVGAMGEEGQEALDAEGGGGGGGRRGGGQEGGEQLEDAGGGVYRHGRKERRGKTDWAMRGR